MVTVKRGEIYYANLTGVGSEQKGRKAVLILQNDEGNQYSPTTIVCIITSRAKKNIPTHVYLGCNYGLVKDSTAVLEQIKTIDKKRLLKKFGYIDENNSIWDKIDQAIITSLSIKAKKVLFPLKFKIPYNL